MALHDMIVFWRRRFLAATIAFTVVASGLVIIARHELSAREAAAALGRLEEKLPQVSAASRALEQTLAGYRTLLPRNYDGRSVETLLFEGLDDLKSRFPGAQLTITACTDQPEGVALPFTLRVTAVDYAGFVNTLSRLQARLFPFVTIQRVAIDYDQPAKATVAYKVEGTLMAPKHNGKGGTP